MGECWHSEQNCQGHSFSIGVDWLGGYYMTYIIEGGFEKSQCMLILH